MLRAFLSVCLPIVTPLCLLAGIVVAGRWARAQLRHQEDCSITFTAIDCSVPVGLSRSDFLAEVQYLAALPDRLCLLDLTLPARLKDAFERHPWVEEARVGQGRAPRTVRIDLTFRKPVLLVGARDVLRGGPGELRLVDRHGVLLPRAAASSSLPLLRGEGLPAPGPTGKKWGDRRVEEAAALAAFLQPRGAEIDFMTADIEPTAAGLVLHHQSRRIVWGKPPGKEGDAEPTADVKWQRLREYFTAPEVADDRPCDLRPLQGPASRGVYAFAGP
jgi:hypothetical protein